MTSSTFAYRAIRRNGTEETGVLDAPSREAALQAIGARGAFPIEVTPAATPGATASRAPRMREGDLAQGLRALATLLTSGIPLARAFQVLEDLAPPTWRPLLPGIRQRIAQGESVAEALEGSALPMPAHIQGLLRAGDAGSGLALAVQQSAQLLEERAAARTALRNALAYPMMLGVAGSASVAILVGVVLPRFASLLADTGQTLPLTTRVVLASGAMVRIGFPWFLPLVTAAIVGWRLWTGTPEGRLRWHGLLLGIPVVGAIRGSRATANACAALGALLRTGVPLATALPHAARASGDRAVEHRLLAARQRIGRGEPFAAALQAELALTPPSIRLVRVGEEAGGGRLTEMLEQAARIESLQVTHRVQRLVRIVEPAMILVFGGLVMLVAAALLQAMYGLRPGG